MFLTLTKKNTSSYRNYLRGTLLITVICIPSICYANSGVPMIFLGLPFLIITLIPVIICEAYLMKKNFPLMESRKAIKATSAANITSTIIGYPLSWLLLLFIQFITIGGSAIGLKNILSKVMSVSLQAAWLIPYESELDWMIPVAGIIGLLIAFPITVYCELYVYKKMLKVDNVLLQRFALKSNLVSYTFLFSILIIRLLSIKFS